MSSDTIGVLFVCLGNICRSPMAEGIFRKLVDDRDLVDRFVIDSCGTAAYHEGEGADPRSMAVLRKYGAGFDHQARQVRREDFDRFDAILAMDDSNLANLRQACPPVHHPKLAKVLEPIGGGNVADPYYGGPEGFDVNYRQLDKALDAWLERWL